MSEQQIVNNLVNGIELGNIKISELLKTAALKAEIRQAEYAKASESAIKIRDMVKKAQATK